MESTVLEPGADQHSRPQKAFGPEALTLQLDGELPGEEPTGIFC